MTILKSRELCGVLQEPCVIYLTLGEQMALTKQSYPSRVSLVCHLTEIFP